MSNPIKKANFKDDGKVWVTLQSGLKLMLFDFGKTPIPFKESDLIGKSIQEAFELKSKSHEV